MIILALSCGKKLQQRGYEDRYQVVFLFLFYETLRRPGKSSSCGTLRCVRIFSKCMIFCRPGYIWIQSVWIKCCVVSTEAVKKSAYYCSVLAANEGFHPMMAPSSQNLMVAMLGGVEVYLQLATGNYLCTSNDAHICITE